MKSVPTPSRAQSKDGKQGRPDKRHNNPLAEVGSSRLERPNTKQNQGYRQGRQKSKDKNLEVILRPTRYSIHMTVLPRAPQVRVGLHRINNA